jgi:hypothetical protein
LKLRFSGETLDYAPVPQQGLGSIPVDKACNGTGQKPALQPKWIFLTEPDSRMMRH